MLKYFDLNDRARKGEPARDVSGLASPVRQLAMYIGIFLGVIFSTAVEQFREGVSIGLTLTTGKILISAIIAIMIIPTVYEKLNLNPEAPFIVQFGLFVQNGVFWSVAIDLISKV
ncbi:MAG: hypothetical protein PVF58_21490 [Candidatus Methanofastidiosia archaeon]|jgi:hypothetical protein